jgi:hypothetical protein
MLKVASADADGQKSLQIRLDGRLVAASPVEKTMEFDLAGGRSYEWQLVDSSGKIARSGKLEMPDSNSQLKID